MSIVKLKKLTLCGLKKEKTEVLKKLQDIGDAHIIPLNKKKFSTEIDTLKQTEKAVHVLKYLTQCPKRRHQVHDKNNFAFEQIINQVLRVEADLRRLLDQHDFLLNRIKQVQPWGDFTLSSEDDLKGIKFWFYIIPKRVMKLLYEGLIYKVVHEDNLHCYVVVVSKEEPPASNIPVPRTHTGSKSLSELNDELQKIKLALEDKQAERESLTRWITLIRLSLAENEDNVALKIADSQCKDDKNIFIIQAWIPESSIVKLKLFAEENGLALMMESVSKRDRPPTLLKNTEQLAGGEDVVQFYQIPAYDAWDPSIVVFFSFAFFFAMILSDAGYAITFGLLLALKWKRIGQHKQGLRLRKLALITIVFSVVWGVLSGGYFGYAPAENSIAGTLKIIDINNFDNMMQLSIIIGALHLVLANLIKAYQYKQSKTAWSSLGWIFLIIGGMLLWLNLVSQQVVIYFLLTLGVSLLLFFSSERMIKRPIDLIWQVVAGLKNLTKITKIFGDILSYMRLFALGLASASLALTFNQLAEQAYNSESGLGLLFSILIIILGHTLNLMLCLMSGVVHGLRLNFIEFYNWSISDEGYPFKAFSKKGGG